MGYYAALGIDKEKLYKLETLQGALTSGQAAEIHQFLSITITVTRQSMLMLTATVSLLFKNPTI